MSYNYILSPDGKLMHTDLSKVSYIDLDEKEFCHWKYIKRVKLPNGKWRYYYEDDELDAKAQTLNRARNNLLRAGVLKAAAKSKLDSAKQNNFYKNSRSSVTKQADIYNKVTKARSDYDKASADRAKAETAVKTAEKSYKSQKVKDLPEKIVSKGVVFVANLITGTRDDD